MFLELISFLTQFDAGFNVLQYLTVRAVLAMLAALVHQFNFGAFFHCQITATSNRPSDSS